MSERAIAPCTLGRARAPLPRAAAVIAAALAWLRSPAFEAWGVAVSWSEVLGDLTGAACVALLARQRVESWPLGLANNVFWALLFADAALYADAALQGAFFVLGVYGWWQWVRGRAGGALPVRRTTPREWIAPGVVTGLGWGAAWAFLGAATDSPAPLWDAGVLALSLLATWAQAHKWLPSWGVWIAVDVISVPLYLSRGLYPTAALYVVFGALCVVGFRDWARSARA
jgi:nicotinamide mononucleotide transporter